MLAPSGPRGGCRCYLSAMWLLASMRCSGPPYCPLWRRTLPPPAGLEPCYRFLTPAQFIPSLLSAASAARHQADAAAGRTQAASAAGTRWREELEAAGTKLAAAGCTRSTPPQAHKLQARQGAGEMSWQPPARSWQPQAARSARRRRHASCNRGKVPLREVPAAAGEKSWQPPARSWQPQARGWQPQARS